MRKTCTDWSESPQAMDRRIDAMLREMVVESGLELMEEGHDPEPMTLEEIADFVGASAVTLHRIEQNALKKIRNKMLNLKS